MARVTTEPQFQASAQGGRVQNSRVFVFIASPWQKCWTSVVQYQVANECLRGCAGFSAMEHKPKFGASVGGESGPVSLSKSGGQKLRQPVDALTVSGPTKRATAVTPWL